MSDSWRIHGGLEEISRREPPFKQELIDFSAKNMTVHDIWRHRLSLAIPRLLNESRDITAGLEHLDAPDEILPNPPEMPIIADD